MSHQAVDYVLAQDIKSSPQKLLMVAIAYHVDVETGKWILKQKSLMKRGSMSERQVRLHTKALEDDRRIIRRERRNPDGSQAAYEYELVGYAKWMECRDEAAVSIFETERERLQAAEIHRQSTGGGNRPHPGAEIDPTPPAETRRHKTNSPSSKSSHSGVTLHRETPSAEGVPETLTQANAAKPKKQAAGTRIAADWQPTEANRAWAKKWGVPDHAVELAADAFHTYWTECRTKSALKVDWPAAFRIWMSKDLNRLRTVKPPVQTDGITGADRTYATEWAEYERTSRWSPYFALNKLFSGPEDVPQRIRDFARTLFGAGQAQGAFA